MRRSAYTLIELLAAVAIIAVLIALLAPAIVRVQESAGRANCASNLRQIGIAMICYAEVNGGRFPAVAPPRFPTATVVGTNDASTSWRNLVPIGSRAASDGPRGMDGIDDPFNEAPPHPVPVHKSVTASLWLLCRTPYQPLPERTFVCPSVKRKSSRRDPMAETDGLRRGSVYFSDFYVDTQAGPLVSYSFHNPWSAQWRSGTAKPGFILAGDENNGMDPTAHEYKGDPARYRIDPLKANSLNHRTEGQNLLAADNSVKFASTAHAGLNDDNVYTAYGEVAGISAAPRYQPGIKDINPAHTDFDTVLIPLDDDALKASD